MRILIGLDNYNPVIGGPFYSVTNLARELLALGHRVALITTVYPGNAEVLPPEGVELFSSQARLLPGIRQSWAPHYSKTLERAIDQFRPHVVHGNGIWLSSCHRMARACFQRGIPRVVSPRGQLDPWSFQYRNFKKRLALRLYASGDLRTAACFHAASAEEADSIRNFVEDSPIATVPNGVYLPAAWGTASSEEQAKTLIFIGRVHPIKGLIPFLQAWGKVRPSGWRFQIVGAEENGHRGELEKLVRDHRMEASVSFLGPLHGAEKDEVLRKAGALVLPSFSENFGLAVVEGMAYGLPVIASTGTPWSELAVLGAGWWVKPEPESFAEALRELTALSDQQRQGMGKRGRSRAEAAYGWPAIAKDMVEVYKWVVDRGALPAMITPGKQERANTLVKTGR